MKLKTVAEWLPDWAASIEGNTTAESGLSGILTAEVESVDAALRLVNLRIDNMTMWWNGLRPRKPLFL